MLAGESRARILFLTPQAPYPPEQGTAIRNYNLIRQVSRRHQVGLLTFADQETDAVALGEIDASCLCARAVAEPTRTTLDRLGTLLLSGRPDMADRLASEDFTLALRAILEEHDFDVVQVEGIEMAPYGLLVRQWYGPHGPAIVFDDHNAEFVLQRRAWEADVRRVSRWPAAAYSMVQWRRLRRFERLVCARADAVACVSEADREAIWGLCGQNDLLVLPNGVDVERYRPGLGDKLSLRHPSVVFTGKMDYRPNVDAILWFYGQVWPRIREDCPAAHLYVVGKQPHPRLNPLRQDASVTVTGYVEDPVPYFAGADVYIVPLRIGGGTRLKVLEAMATGCAVVTTTLGCEGIGLASGEHALIRDQAAAFAQAVVDLATDDEAARSLGHQARQFVLQQYDWRQIVPRLYPIYTRFGRRPTPI